MGKCVGDPPPAEDPLAQPEMFENPLYGSLSSFPKPAPRKEQESPKTVRKEPPSCPEPSNLHTKALDPDATKGPGKPIAGSFVVSPTPRLRSFTCLGMSGGGDKGPGKPKGPAGTQAPVPTKRPIKPSRSDLSQPAPPGPAPRPPLPAKSPAVLHLQHSQGRDYRDNTELPHHGKHRPDEPLGRTTMPVSCGPERCHCGWARGHGRHALSAQVSSVPGQ